MTLLRVSNGEHVERHEWFEKFQYVSNETQIEYFEWFKDILFVVLKTIFVKFIVNL